jgi:hypothetical protein
VNASRILIPLIMIVMCAGVISSCGPSDNGIALSPTATATPPLAPSPTIPGGTEAPLGIPASGDNAPDFTLPSVWGDAFTLSHYRGEQNVVLLFYRTGS